MVNMFSKIKLCFSLYMVYMTLICVSCADLSGKQESDIIKYLTKQTEGCVVRDVNTLNQCLKDVAINLKPYFPYGIKLWKVPALEPMAIKSIKISQNNGGTRLTAIFKDLLVSGLSQYAITFLESRPEKYTFKIGMHFPRLAIKGNYDIDGQVLVLTLKDKGPFTANLTEVQAKANMNFKVDGGKLRLYECDSDFNFKSIRFHLDNLFQGSDLGETVNESLNSSTDDLLQEFKPAFVKEINKIILQAFQEALSHIPLAKWQRAFKK